MTPLLAAIFILGAVAAQTYCPTDRTSSLQFYVKSEVNATGQRMVTVEMRGEGAQESPLEMSVDHWTTVCRGAEVTAFKVNVTDPNSVKGAPSDGTSLVESDRSTVPPWTSTPAFAHPCKPGYTLMSGIGCYKGNNTMLSWDAMRLSCKAEGAHLDAPDSEQERDALWTIIAQVGLWDPWVGVHKMNGAWQTVEGGTGFLRWYPGDPNGRGDCVFLWTSQLRNYNSDRGRYFICEHSPM